jgi:hypothetical protein
MSDRTITTARLNRLAKLRAQNDAICAPYLDAIAEITSKMTTAQGDLPAEIAEIETDIKAITLRTGRTFVGTTLQSVFSNRRKADLDGLERDGLERYITYSKSVSIRKVGRK